MIKYSIVFIILLLTITFYLIQTKVNNECKLLVPENNKIYFAAFPNFGESEDIVSTHHIEKFEKLVTKKMVWAEFSQHWFNGLAYPKDKIQTIADKNIIPYVRLLPRSSLDQNKIEKKFTLEKIINGNFDIELIQWAKDANRHNVPIIIDFAVEMNGDWFGWSGHYNGADRKDGYGDLTYPDGPEKYRDAYRHIIDIFRAEHVKHVTWFFHPDISSSPNEEWNSAKYYYPGDDYIDWIGISIYGAFYPTSSDWVTFDEILERNFKKILDISSTKPLAIVELGVTDHHPLGEKDKWLKDAFNTILTQKYLNFKAVAYWHESWDNDEESSSMRIDSSPKSLRTFQELINNEKFTSKVNLSGRK